MNNIFCVGAFALALLPQFAAAKSIAFAKGKTFMAEFGAGTMNEAQAFYAPRYWYSTGVGWTELTSVDNSKHRTFTYVRANLLAHRCSLPSAQGNVFVWGGLGQATANELSSPELARELGFQLDYETRRVYASFKADQFESSHLSHRIDTLQLGWAPYKHDYDTLATWIVFQGRTYTGDIMPGVEKALLVRFFKGGTWVEAGASTEGKLQAMIMFNF